MTKLAEPGFLFMTQRSKKPNPLAESTPSVALHHLYKIDFHQLIPSPVLLFVVDVDDGFVFICFSLFYFFFSLAALHSLLIVYTFLMLT